MNKLNDKAIAEAAYYIWKNNGCPANTCLLYTSEAADE